MVTGDSCNRNNFMSNKPSTRVHAAPGGNSSLSLGWDEPVKQRQVTPPPEQKVQEQLEPSPQPVQQSVQQSPARTTQSSNAWASNSNQNCGNMITDRPSTRVHAPPGGKSSITF
eukprot:TRINITY_DN7586_c0_g2_i2.p2 TRINITY_DN7586_c0_g2~~TRINITY_DN7586_c0_g2_i2.p2  ORF type:complete len:114 (+),score=21.13 TRINITY_DN7586_c0_g2_i2:37-378(+)